jgi:hypothetical protein
MANFRSYVATIVDVTTNALVGLFNMQEGQLPSTVNNSVRQLAADIKTTYNELPWYDIGHTPTRTGNTTFTIPTDVTAIYTADRRLKLGDSSTLYASVVSSSFGAGVTTITVKTDDGSNLSASLTTVAYSIEDPEKVSEPSDFDRKNFGVTTGSASAYVLTLTPALPALRDGARVRLYLHANCAATPTLNVSGTGAKTIVLAGGVSIDIGDLTAGSVLSLVYLLSDDKWLVEGPPTVVSNVVLQTLHAVVRSL